MVVTFTITMRGFEIMDGKITISLIFGGLAMVNDGVSIFESNTFKSISTHTLFTAQTSGYHHFVWKKCLFLVYFVVAHFVFC